MSTEEKKYLVLITFEDESQTWRWLSVHHLDEAKIEIKNIFLDKQKIYDKEVLNIQIVCADNCSINYMDKQTVMHDDRKRNVIMAYNDDGSDGDSENIVPYGLIPVKDLVYLPRDSDYGIMLNSNFEICFDNDGQLSVSLGHGNEIGHEHYGKIMNMDWWFDEARRKLRRIQEDRDDFDIMISPDGKRSCYIKWSEEK